jgi:hypothetical protein
MKSNAPPAARIHGFPVFSLPQHSLSGDRTNLVALHSDYDSLA